MYSSFLRKHERGIFTRRSISSITYTKQVPVVAPGLKIIPEGSCIRRQVLMQDVCVSQKVYRSDSSPETLKNKYRYTKGQST